MAPKVVCGVGKSEAAFVEAEFETIMSRQSRTCVSAGEAFECHSQLGFGLLPQGLLEVLGYSLVSSITS